MVAQIDSLNKRHVENPNGDEVWSVFALFRADDTNSDVSSSAEVSALERIFL